MTRKNHIASPVEAIAAILPCLDRAPWTAGLVLFTSQFEDIGRLRQKSPLGRFKDRLSEGKLSRDAP
jgi:hypothetical protein